METFLSSVLSMVMEPFFTALFGAAILIVRDILKSRLDLTIKIKKLPDHLDSSFRLPFSTKKITLYPMYKTTKEIAIEHFPNKSMEDVYKILKTLKDEGEIVIAEDNDDYRRIFWTKSKD